MSTLRAMSAGLLLAGMAIVGTGCATSEEWAVWKGNSAHFASGEHMGFSLRNREGSATQVTRTDVAAARDQSWWGKAITVDQSAVLER